jgi:SAM-dependent methyltransferase
MTGKTTDYILGVGDAGAKRLHLLHQVYGPGSERLLSDLGLGPGLRVADVGCGVGTVSLWMAQQVGLSGAVVCVDNSAQQLALVRLNAEENGYGNMTFLEASADHVDLPDESLDLVYCRFLLDHLENPFAALAEMRRLLKPQGTLVSETIDLMGMATDPPDPAYSKEVDYMRELSAVRGIDAGSGMKIHRLFRQVGFQRIEVRLNQPAYLQGEEKRFWEYSVAESIPAVVDRGFYTLEHMQSRVQGMQQVNADESILVALPRSVQVWARK